MQPHDAPDTIDGGRRRFLKKVGAAAWVVPTLQAVNMASAGAQTSGSTIPTTAPPTTTEGPDE